MQLNEFIAAFASEHKIADIEAIDEGVIIAPLSDRLWLVRSTVVRE